jgi:hypothetical protein
MSTSITSLDEYLEDTTKGFKISLLHRSVASISSAGDVNGDGVDDLIIGAPHSTTEHAKGAVYIVYGSKWGLPSIPSLDSYITNPSNGAQFFGAGVADDFGMAVSKAGDINHDGIGDIIIGAPRKQNEENNGVFSLGANYILYGSRSLSFSLSNIEDCLNDRSKGFMSDGRGDYSHSPGGDLVFVAGVFGLGSFVSSIGDINGDNIHDVVVGASHAFLRQRWDVGVTMPLIFSSGMIYVLFGKAGGITYVSQMRSEPIDRYVENIIEPGFRMFSNDTGNFGLHHYSTASGGDINGDGINDVIIGLPYLTFTASSSIKVGAVYILFGKNRGQFVPHMDPLEKFLADSANGITVHGSSGGDCFGSDVKSIGDFNGDGFEDIAVVSTMACSNNLPNKGSVIYVIFGCKQMTDIDSIDSYLDTSEKGFKIYGSTELKSVSLGSVVDLNGDGLNDLVISSYPCDAFVIYGRRSGLENIKSITEYLSDSSRGFSLHVEKAECFKLISSGAGDINGDGIDDLILAPQYTNTEGSSLVYVLYGSRHHSLVTMLAVLFCFVLLVSLGICRHYYNKRSRREENLHLFSKDREGEDVGL